MKQFLLKHINNEATCDYLNACGLEIEIIYGEEFYLQDCSTGQRMLSNGDRALLSNINREAEHFLKLKFGEDIEEYSRRV